MRAVELSQRQLALRLIVEISIANRWTLGKLLVPIYATTYVDASLRKRNT